jgi:signal transduction histidine kinase
VAEATQVRERFAHLARVDAVSAMSAAIAHELNQPLMAIQNYALAGQRRLASAGLAERTKLDELLTKIGEQAAFASEVLERVRAMVKRRETQETKMDLPRLIHSAVQLIETEARLKDIGVETRVAPGLPPALGDEIQIQQVILNLAHNAIEAMAALRTGAAVLRLEAMTSRDEGILIRVVDRGPGIAPADEERIFEAFHTTKASGLGIGLSLSRTIVEAHGGKLMHVPNPGGGTIFQFTLPCAGDGL